MRLRVLGVPVTPELDRRTLGVALLRHIALRHLASAVTAFNQMGEAGQLQAMICMVLRTDMARVMPSRSETAPEVVSGPESIRFIDDRHLPLPDGNEHEKVIQALVVVGEGDTRQLYYLIFAQSEHHRHDWVPTYRNQHGTPLAVVVEEGDGRPTFEEVAAALSEAVAKERETS